MTFKITIERINNPGTIKMKDMKPFQIGRIQNPSMDVYNHIVMRTASSETKEVIDLSIPGEDSCWTWTNEGPDIEVFPFPIGTEILLIITE